MTRARLFWSCLLSVIVSIESFNCPHICTCRNTIINCSSKSLSYIPENIPNTSTVLIMDNNDLVTINVEALVYLTNLTNLSLASNAISTIPIAIFKYLPNLQHLQLSENRLTFIPDGLQQLIALDTLDLSSNRITNVTEEDAINIKHIRDVNLRNNSIRAWPIKPLNYVKSSLQKLDLSHNKLEVLHEFSFTGYTSLVNLNASHNVIERINNHANFSPSLKSLDLSNNLIRYIGNFNIIGDNMQNLTLADNRIQEIDSLAFAFVKELYFLNLSNNQLYNIGAIWIPYNLKHLDLSYNLLYDVQASLWHNGNSLQWLSLANNKMTDIAPNSFEPLKKLEYLSLENNQIKHVNKKSFIGLSSLEEMDLSHNELAICVEDRAVLPHMPSLRKLDFSSNRIGAIPSKAFSDYQSLEFLDLSENPIATIAEGAFDDIELEELRIFTTDLICDCRLAWFPNWLAQSTIKTHSILMHCNRPLSLRGVDVVSANTSSWTCVKPSPQAKIVDSPGQIIHVKTGTELRLFCRGHGEAPISIFWKVFDNDMDQMLNETSDISIFANNTIDDANSENEYITSELIVRHVKNPADYQCVVSNRHGHAYSLHAKIQLYMPPKIVRRSSPEIAIMVNTTMDLICEVEGIPEVTRVFEKKNDRKRFAILSQQERLHYDTEGLHLLKVQKEDEGDYQCTAKNSFGTDIAITRLMVFEKSFTNSMQQQQHVRVRSLFSLFCNTDINMPHKINWYFKNQRIHAKNTLGIIFRGNRSEMLVIPSAQLTNAGEYKCVITVGDQNLPLDSQFANVDVHTIPPGDFSAVKDSTSPITPVTIRLTTMQPPNIRTPYLIDMGAKNVELPPEKRPSVFDAIVRVMIDEYRSWQYHEQVFFLLVVCMTSIMGSICCYAYLIRHFVKYLCFKIRSIQIFRHTTRDRATNTSLQDTASCEESILARKAYRVSIHDPVVDFTEEISPFSTVIPSMYDIEEPRRSVLLKRSQYFADDSPTPSQGSPVNCITYAYIHSDKFPQEAVSTRRLVNDAAAISQNVVEDPHP